MQQPFLASFSITIFLGLLCNSCAAPEKPAPPVVVIAPVVPAPPVRTHFILREEEAVHFRSPLPSMRLVRKEWHYSDGRIENVPGLRMWDFNGDGNPDFIEKLSETGEVDELAMDYNFDGRPDELRTPGTSIAIKEEPVKAAKLIAPPPPLEQDLPKKKVKRSRIK